MCESQPMRIDPGGSPRPDSIAAPSRDPTRMTPALLYRRSFAGTTPRPEVSPPPRSPPATARRHQPTATTTSRQPHAADGARLVHPALGARAPARPGAGSSPSAPGRRTPAGSAPSAARARRSRTRAAPRRPARAAPAASDVVPAADRVVVVGAGVDDLVLHVVLRHVLGVRARTGVKPNCSTAMPGSPSDSRSRVDRRRDHAEVLGDQRQLAQRRAGGVERRARPGRASTRPPARTRRPPGTAQ